MQDITFRNLCMIWLKYKSSTIKQTSAMQYHRIITKYFDVYLGDILLKKITVYDILNFIDQIKKDLSSKSLQDIMVVLKSILRYGHILGYCYLPIEVLPCIKSPKKEISILTFTELQMIKNYMVETLNHKNIGILICLYTGIRLGEICALKWEDIDFQSQKISIQKSVHRISENGKSYTMIELPKTAYSIRNIPIHSYLLNILYLCQYRDGYILTGTEKYLDPRSYQYYFQKILNHLGIKKYRFHTLRHTFATRCVQCQMDIKSLSEILGHSSVSITLDTYVHSSFEMKRLEMNKLKFI